MRTLLSGALFTAALLLPAAQASAQCCQSTERGHAPHTAAAAMPCCAAHAAAASPCCDDHAAAAMPCCDDHAMTAAPARACRDDALTIDDRAVALAGLGLAEAPAVQTLDIVFRDPVRVGDTLLMGAYRIEHDTERMARGEPCTHIYARDDLRTPVATFHCEHLEAGETATATVTLAPTINGAIRAMTGFQFAGETAVHAVPIR